MSAGPPLRLIALGGIEDPAQIALTALPGHSGAGDRSRELIEQTLAFVNANPRPDPWGSYLGWDEDHAVGVCSFKSEPDSMGDVEIAYATFPDFESRGYAKRMISALVELAQGAGAACVFANTLPEENPSNRALRRRGFQFAGERVDDEDGLVWRWEKRLNC